MKFRSFWLYDVNIPISIQIRTFFSLGILKVPWDSLVSISRLWISISLFLTWYSTSNFSPNTLHDLSYSSLQSLARSSLLMEPTSGRDPTFSSTASGTPILESDSGLRSGHWLPDQQGHGFLPLSSGLLRSL